MNKTKLQKVIVVIGDKKQGEAIRSCLEVATMHCVLFKNTVDAMREVRATGTPGLFIVSLDLPSNTAKEFIASLRSEYKPTIPIILINSNSSDESAIDSINLGVDSYLKSPSIELLCAMAKNVLRRYAIYSSTVERSICFDDYTLLLNSNILKKGDKRISLSVLEYGVLEYLILNSPHPILPEKIYTEVWKAPYGDVTAVAVYVQRLRKKIEINPVLPCYIKTEFGRGYYFDRARITYDSSKSK